MSFNPGDKPTVSRGKLRTQTVEITAGPDANGAYVVTALDGNYYTIPASNLKAPAEATISLSDLADVLYANRERDAESVTATLAANMPGLREAIARRASAIANMESGNL